MDKDISNLDKTKGFRPELFTDDSEIGEIHFKAITDGLGFHNEDEKIGVKNFNREAKSPILKNSINVKLENKPVKKAVSQNETLNYMGGLEAFYKEDQKITSIKAKTLKIKKKLVLASSFERGFAYVADIAIIIAFIAITFGTIVVTSGLDLSLISELLTAEELSLYGSIIFILNYALYFTILDIKSSPGKMLLGLKLVKNKDQRISAMLAFSRALLSLTLLFMVTSLHDKICSTRVVKIDESL